MIHIYKKRIAIIHDMRDIIESNADIYKNALEKLDNNTKIFK